MVGYRLPAPAQNSTYNAKFRNVLPTSLDSIRESVWGKKIILKRMSFYGTDGLNRINSVSASKHKAHCWLCLLYTTFRNIIIAIVNVRGH